MSPSRALALLVATVATTALAQAEARKPSVYALLSAVGSRFEVIHVQQQTGTEWSSSFRRARLDNLPDPILAELRKMDRRGWDRLLVAVPARRVEDKEGLGRRMQGLGIFVQPLCQSDTGWGGRIGSCETGFRPVSGPEAHTPKGEAMAASNFVAPYSFIEVWVLDPRSLEVIDRTTQYGHRKLADSSGSITGIVAGFHDDFLATQIVAVVQSAARGAVEDAGLRGKVQVHEKGPVPAVPK